VAKIRSERGVQGRPKESSLGAKWRRVEGRLISWMNPRRVEKGARRRQTVSGSKQTRNITQTRLIHTEQSRKRNSADLKKKLYSIIRGQSPEEHNRGEGSGKLSAVG